MDDMIYIETDSLDAAFHFSVEEHIVRTYPWDEPVLMIWRTNKCAMLGSNQIAQAELDVRYAEQEGIQIVRRSSGGGTIFTDPGTLLYTMIQPYSDEYYPLDIARQQVGGPVAEALEKMGIPARVEGRNDILVDGKKVSGLAQYVQNGRVCTHGSLLYDADLEMLTRVIRVDDEKIRSKALKSIRSRVTNLKEHLANPCSALEFRELLKQHLFCGQNVREVKLTDHDLSQVDAIYREKYGNPLWTLERSPKFTFSNSMRFPGGRVDVGLDVVKGVVSSCSIRGDFLGVVLIRGLESLFEGLPFQYQAFSDAIEGVSLLPYLGAISADELLSCIFAQMEH